MITCCCVTIPTRTESGQHDSALTFRCWIRDTGTQRLGCERRGTWHQYYGEGRSKYIFKHMLNNEILKLRGGRFTDE